MVAVGWDFFALIDGEADMVLDLLLIDPLHVVLASDGLGPMRTWRTTLFPGRTRPSSDPRVEVAFDDGDDVEFGLLSVVVDVARVDRSDEGLRMNLTGDVEPALSERLDGGSSTSSFSLFNGSNRCFLEPSVELTELPDLRPRLGVIDAVVAACEWRPSAVDRGRGEAFERLPFGVLRAIDDAVGFEAVDGVATNFLSVAAMVRFGGIPFFGDALCTLSLVCSCFLATGVFVVSLPGVSPNCSILLVTTSCCEESSRGSMSGITDEELT